MEPDEQFVSNLMWFGLIGIVVIIGYFIFS